MPALLPATGGGLPLGCVKAEISGGPLSSYAGDTGKGAMPVRAAGIPPGQGGALHPWGAPPSFWRTSPSASAGCLWGLKLCPWRRQAADRRHETAISSREPGFRAPQNRTCRQFSRRAGEVRGTARPVAGLDRETARCRACRVRKLPHAAGIPAGIDGAPRRGGAVLRLFSSSRVIRTGRGATPYKIPAFSASASAEC